MNFVTWTKELEIGIPFIDSDHRLLVNLINQANDCINKREESTTLSGILSILYDYTKYHFAREEKLMEVAGFDGLQPHRVVHESFAGQVKEINHEFLVNPESISAVEVRDLLKNWLVTHITGNDFEYRDACLNNEAAWEQAGAMLFMEEERKQSAETTGDFNDLSVMVVDDNSNFLILVETILKALGIRRVQTEKSATAAIHKLINRPVDLVFCDWIMDEMNGDEFARKVKDLQLPTKVVLLTGYSIKGLQERSSNDAVGGYLEKPVSAKSLLEKITSSINC